MSMNKLNKPLSESLLTSFPISLTGRERKREKKTKKEDRKAAAATEARTERRKARPTD